MDQQDLDTLNLKDPDIAWAILTPSLHLTDYPVDDLNALHLVYVHQCWHPPLSRTLSARQSAARGTNLPAMYRFNLRVIMGDGVRCGASPSI
jgi:hypothetical protein